VRGIPRKEKDRGQDMKEEHATSIYSAISSLVLPRFGLGR
jgi:hypothetical protein